MLGQELETARTELEQALARWEAATGDLEKEVAADERR
jgi:hypothetical protein